MVLLQSSNVVKLVSLVKKDMDDQLCYYQVRVQIWYSRTSNIRVPNGCILKSSYIGRCWDIFCSGSSFPYVHLAREDFGRGFCMVSTAVEMSDGVA